MTSAPVSTPAICSSVVSGVKLRSTMERTTAASASSPRELVQVDDDVVRRARDDQLDRLVRPVLLDVRQVRRGERENPGPHGHGGVGVLAPGGPAVAPGGVTGPVG